MVTFVDASVASLRAATFLDGREPFAGSATRKEPAAAVPQVAFEPVRVILHVSFCGSTLLSRLLGRPRSTLVLREPRVQIDLADWRAALAGGGECIAKHCRE